MNERQKERRMTSSFSFFSVFSSSHMQEGKSERMKDPFKKNSITQAATSCVGDRFLSTLLGRKRQPHSAAAELSLITL